MEIRAVRAELALSEAKQLEAERQHKVRAIRVRVRA